MNRRHFIQTGIAGLGALIPCAMVEGQTSQEELPPTIVGLQSLRSEEPRPISEAERAERRAKAQRVMSEQNIDAMLVEPGPSLNYFTGVAWGRSERLFGMLLPRRGNPVFVSPAFEQQRAEGQIGGRYSIRVWQEDESVSGLVASILKDWSNASGTIALVGSARFFVATRSLKCGRRSKW